MLTANVARASSDVSSRAASLTPRASAASLEFRARSRSVRSTVVIGIAFRSVDSAATVVLR